MLLMLVKRILPFALMLSLGIFIASFFVTLTIPQIKFERRYEYHNECRWNKRAARERVRQEFQNRDFQDLDSQDLDEMAPPPPVAPAIPFEKFTIKPPAAPTVPRNHR